MKGKLSESITCIGNQQKIGSSVVMKDATPHHSTRTTLLDLIVTKELIIFIQCGTDLRIKNTFLTT